MNYSKVFLNLHYKKKFKLDIKTSTHAVVTKDLLLDKKHLVF